MPCRDEFAEEMERKARINRLNQVTRAACDMRTILRRNNLESQLTVETRQWIAEHDDWDRRRIAEETANGEREKAKQRALAKLNIDDRRVLGL